VLADTAGLRAAAEEIEGEGIRRAYARAERADATLLVFDATRLPDLDADTLELIDERAVLVLNKADAATGPLPDTLDGRPLLAVSAASGQGLEALVTALAEAAARALDGGDAPALTRERHRAALAEAEAALRRALAAPADELAAEDVRLAARALGRITGRVDVEDVLDAIFREFCIGK